MLLEIVSAAYLLTDFIYSKLNDKSDGKHRPAREFTLPRVDHGSPVPLIYGRCLVRAPVLADLRVTNVVHSEDSDVVLVNIMMIVGIGMKDGSGTTRLRDMYSGDKRAVSNNFGLTTGSVDSNGKWLNTGNGGLEDPIEVAIEDAGEGLVEVLNGNPAQVLAEDGDTDTTAQTWAGRCMLRTISIVGRPSDARTVDEIPGYRSYLCAFLFNIVSGSGWSIGGANVFSVPPYSFEASSYPTGEHTRVGADCNPADVILDLLTSKFGKLGISEDYVDLTSFATARETLWGESHGYSRALEDVKDLGEHITDVLKQIDGVAYVDESTSEIVLKLIRADYDPETIPQLTKDNCDSEGTTFASGGWTGTVNAVRVVYSNRERDYADDSEVAQDSATAVGQDGEVRWKVIQMPGVTTAALAKHIADRELAYYSRPIIKGHAIVDRSLGLRLQPGDPIRAYFGDISGLIFRVVAVDRGADDNNRIALDLVQDVSYVFRGQIPEPPSVIDTGYTGFDGLGGLG